MCDDEARTIADGLASMISEILWADPDDEFTAEGLAQTLGWPAPVRSAEEYRQTGLLTHDAGVLLRLDNGAEFQVTVVQSKRARPEDA